MKDNFKSFHNVSTEELKESWAEEKTIFVFDTNVFLNLYGYAKQTRDDFFRLIKKLGDRVWIPHQVGLEYQRRRLEVIKNEKVVFNDIESNLQKIENVFKGDFEQLALKRRFPKLNESTEKLEKEINKSISNYKKSVSHWNNEQPCVRSHDEIRDLLNKYFNGNVGEKPNDQDWLDKLYAEGEQRYKNKIPPGFKDADKANRGEDSFYHFDGLYFERQYGDLILWKQLLSKAASENIDNVIFVTDDSKEDWWYKINSNGKKTIGPLAELQAEIYRESEIQKFHMYSTSSFMEDGKTNLSVVVNKSSIEDAGIQHLQPLNRDDILKNQKIIRSYRDSLAGNEEIKRAQEIIRSFRDPLAENDEMKRAREIMRSYRDPLAENEEIKRAQEIVRSYRAPLVENEEIKRLQEIMRSYREPLVENEEIKIAQDFLRSYRAKKKDDDSNKI
ncbi:MAG: DUF4935 domain-containing protein [Gammaproteobacteria bacterium]|nr:DUF4935 domain-containing protein [Gammaproteobacteria bacterium]